MYKAMKVERQLKLKSIIRQSQQLGPSTPWKPNQKANTVVSLSQPTRKGKAQYLKEKKNIIAAGKGNNDTLTSHNHDIKCFYCLSFAHITSQCPNKKVMVIKANNEVETNGEDEEEKMPILEDTDDVCVDYLIEGKTLMVKEH